MISNPKYGWCKFELGNFIGIPSYITDVPIDLLESFIDYHIKGCGMAWFNEEGTEFTLVINPYSLFIIEEKDNPVLHDFSEIKIDDLEKELILDIERDLDGWANFGMNDNEKTILQYKNRIIQKLDELKLVIDKMRK